MENHLDLYSDYLIANLGQASATGCASVLDHAISHDAITRFLGQEIQDGKALWVQVKSLVKQHQHDDGCLIFDDTIIEKPYMDESDLVAWHWDHCKNRSVKGIQLLSAFYVSPLRTDSLCPVRIPVTFSLIRKDVLVDDPKTEKQKRKSALSKNELVRHMVAQMIANGLKFKYVLADSWYGSVENMTYIAKKDKYFIFDLKSNRQVQPGSEAQDKKDLSASSWVRIDELDLPDNMPTRVWLKDLSFPVLVCKQRFINKDDSIGFRFLVSNDATLSGEEFALIYQKRWGVEEYHKSLKQNVGIAKSPAHSITTQSNHIFAALIAYVKLEKLKFASNLNHFALKTKIFLEISRAAFQKVRNFNLTMDLA